MRAVNPHNAAIAVGGSTAGVGTSLQPFRINDLELVAQMFTSWNPLTSSLRQIDGFQRAA
jgi:hypothetical protein